MGGFRGKLGPAVGYMWNGIWCVRSHQPMVNNPRTPEQTAHRTMFKHQVQTAAKLQRVLNKTMTALARENHMTAYNLFVSCNQHAFSTVEGVPSTDYSLLRLSMGDVAQVDDVRMTLTEHNVLDLRFRRGDGGWHDYVYMYVYVPDLDEDFLSLPVYRGDRRMAAVLPDSFAGHEVHVYLLVSNEDGLWSESLYVGSTATPEEEPVSIETISSPTAESVPSVADDTAVPEPVATPQDGAPPLSDW